MKAWEGQVSTQAHMLMMMSNWNVGATFIGLSLSREHFNSISTKCGH